MTDIKVFKSSQIGGNITMISTEQAKIVIDYGEDLPGDTAADPYSIDWEHEQVDAVFFTHYHADHIGRFTEIPEHIPLYMSEPTYLVIKNHYTRCRDSAALTRLDDMSNIGFMEPEVSVSVGDIVITPYIVDHSAYCSFMFYIETPEKTILHTGDYRDQGRHGRRIVNGESIPAIVDTIRHRIKEDGVRDIDVLITEGTMIGLPSDIRKYTEEDMQAELTKLFRDHRYIFLVISSSNADSLLSFYRAATANGMGFYAGEGMLDQLKIFSRFSAGWDEPYEFDHTWPILKKNDNANVSDKYKRAYAGQRRHMKEEGFVVVVSEKDEDLLEEFSDLDTMLIYSMWSGYINKEAGGEAYNAGLAQFCSRHDAKQIHVSGHAFPSLISEVIQSADPREMIIPIHTDNPLGFLDLSISEEHKRIIKIV